MSKLQQIDSFNCIHFFKHLIKLCFLPIHTVWLLGNSQSHAPECFFRINLTSTFGRIPSWKDVSSKDTPTSSVQWGGHVTSTTSLFGSFCSLTWFPSWTISLIHSCLSDRHFKSVDVPDRFREAFYSVFNIPVSTIAIVVHCLFLTSELTSWFEPPCLSLPTHLRTTCTWFGILFPPAGFEKR